MTIHIFGRAWYLPVVNIPTPFPLFMYVLNNPCLSGLKLIGSFLKSRRADVSCISIKRSKHPDIIFLHEIALNYSAVDSPLSVLWEIRVVCQALNHIQIDKHRLRRLFCCAGFAALEAGNDFLHLSTRTYALCLPPVSSKFNFGILK